MNDHMDQNRNVQVNWRTINIPSLVGILTLALLSLNAYSSFVSKQERQDARMDAIDKERATNLLMYQRQTDFANTQLASVTAQSNKSEYRLTVAEQGLVAQAARQDRLADALGDVRDGMAGIKTSIEVLTEQVRASLQVKRTELETPH